MVFVVAMLVGLFNGLIITCFGVNFFIMTLVVVGCLCGFVYVLGGSLVGMLLDSLVVCGLG